MTNLLKKTIQKLREKGYYNPEILTYSKDMVTFEYWKSIDRGKGHEGFEVVATSITIKELQNG